ncbi:MAG: hydrogenase subunit MbhD domain-containing protein [Desulfurococcus sp.]|uniref:hydrogenase subunit MbhD domain-containing protein n=1 Tax=Desulfurococcus sp. TaxID=51678 RepID=UPI003169BA42
MILTILLLVFSSLLSLVFVYLAVTEKNLLKAIGFSAGQSIAYSIILHAFAATDIVLTYIAVSVGIYSAILVYVVSKTEKYEV